MSLEDLMYGGSSSIARSNANINAMLGYTPSPYYQSASSLISNPTFSGIPSMAAATANGGYSGYGGLSSGQWADINVRQNAVDAYNKRTNSLESQNTTNAWLGGTNAALQGISTIGGLVMSIKNYQMQKDALKKQSQLIDEQIAASKESREQRKAELTRLNNVRSNTNKMFNNSAVVSRSY